MNRHSSVLTPFVAEPFQFDKRSAHMGIPIQADANLFLMAAQSAVNAIQTIDVPQPREQTPANIQVGESNNEIGANTALKLPCHCLDDFRNGLRWSKISDRQDIIDTIHGLFFPTQRDSDSVRSSSMGKTSLKVASLYGMEGVGKTRIAAEYTLRNKSVFPVIFWIDASSEANVRASYRSFAKRLGLLEAEGEETVPDAIIRNSIQSWLSNPKSGGSTVSWLVILDSANDLHVASDVWPHDSEGCLIVTTNQPALASTFVTSEIEIKSLSSTDAADMLLNLTGKRDETNAALYASEIAEAWEGLPGCMELVNMIIRRKRLSLSDFAAIQNDKRPEYLLEKTWYDSKKPSGAFAFLSGLAIDGLQNEHNGELDLLFAISFLDGSHIDEEILRQNPSVATLDNFPRDISSYVDCRRRLWETSIVKHDETLRELRVMTIVQDALLSRTKAAGKNLLDGFLTASALVLSVWPCSITVEGSFSQIKTSERWARCEKLTPHVYRLWDRYMELEGLDKNRFQVEKANPVASSQLLDNGYTVYESAQHEEQNSMLDVLSALHNTRGACCGRINKPKEASEAMQKYLEVQEQIHASSGGKPSGKLAAAYSELALTQIECGQDKDVLRLLGKSTAMRQQLETFTPIDLYNPLRYEGLYHMHIRHDWAKAKKCFFTALLDRKAKYGFDDARGPRAGVLLSNIGDLLCRQDLWEDGYRYHDRAQQSLTAAVKQTHLLSLRARVKVARDMFEINKPGYLTQAKLLLEKCSSDYDQHVFVDGEKARLLLLRGQVLKAMGDDDASNFLALAAQKRNELILKEQSVTADSLEFADFDEIVPLGAR
ncbi:MAG: hypothetical protein Q9222_006790 [Ikaeria aurantiellina]